MFMQNKKLIACAMMMLSLSLLPFLSSCELESSDNGDLDGFWHLESVDTLATNGTCDFSEQRVFWGVQHKLISITHYELLGSRGYYARFEQTGDSLILSTFYKNNWHQDKGPNGGDIPLIEMNDTLRQCGINHLGEHFHKDALSGSKMVLSNKEYRLRFTKF